MIVLLAIVIESAFLALRLWLKFDHFFCPSGLLWGSRFMGQSCGRRAPVATHLLEERMAGFRHTAAAAVSREASRMAPEASIFEPNAISWAEARWAALFAHLRHIRRLQRLWHNLGQYLQTKNRNLTRQLSHFYPNSH
jgi:hypothetical protein